MTPKQIAAIVTAAALATLRQLGGVDPAELEHAARAIGNNAAQAIVFAAEDQPTCGIPNGA